MYLQDDSLHHQLHDHTEPKLFNSLFEDGHNYHDSLSPWKSVRKWRLRDK
jgi:hypothetical protein